MVAAALASITGCKRETFPFNMYKPNTADIDSIYFSAGDIMTIADGKASLEFILESYRKVQHSNGTVTRELLDHRTLPEGSVKVFEEVTNKEISGMKYSTSTMAADTLRFFAQIGQVKSSVKKVALRPKPVLPPKVYVDVIFHVWELNPAHRQYDVASFQSTKYEDIQKALKVMNEVVNNKIGTASNGASANIEFRLAARNALGQTLEQPGYEKIIYSDEVKENPASTGIGYFDFSTYITKNYTKFIWDPTQYLNIHVIAAGSNNLLGTVTPAKQLPAAPGETLIPGVPGIASSPDDYLKNSGHTSVIMPNTLFHPGYERRIEIFGFVGTFYGLYATSTYAPSRFHSDYCADTREYNPQDSRNNFFFATKVGLNGDKFVINNAMDDTRYPSLRNSLTLDQITRMRAVMARCPGRMNSKPL